MGVPYPSPGHEVIRAALLFSLATAAFTAGPSVEPWIEVRAPHVVVITNGGERAGRKTAFQFEQFDRALQKRFPWIQVEDGARLTVIASPEERVVRSLASDSAEEGDRAFSSYLALLAQPVAATRTDLPEPSDKERSPNREAWRGRAGFLIEKSIGTTPPWLVRGLSVFLADTLVKEKEVLAGRMVFADVAAQTALPVADFFKETRTADRRFETQAGLFAHFLLVGDEGKNAAALDALLQRIATRAPAASVQEALARVTSLYASFPKYLSLRKFSPVKLSIDPTVSASTFSIRPLKVAEALMLRAEILFELNRPVDVRGLLREARSADPTLARPYEIEAILCEREQRTAESKQAIETATKLGSRNAALYYRLAQLQWAPTMIRPALQSVAKTLEVARDLAPADPNILAYLADVQSDLGLPDPALSQADRAAKASPRDPYVLLVLARAQWNAKKTEPSQATARSALGLAKIASQRQVAQQLLDFMTRNKRAQAAGTKPYITQVGPPPSGAFGATRAAGDAVSGTGGASLGTARAASTDASAISDCFAKRDDAACARAVPSLETACAEKQSTSCVSLGSLYDGGFGVARDRRKAASNYTLACGLGDKPGCARVAVLEAQGLGVPRNTPKATKTLESLCGENIPDACIGLAQVLRLTGRAADRARARTLLKTACDAGATEACGLLTAR